MKTYILHGQPCAVLAFFAMTNTKLTLWKIRQTTIQLGTIVSGEEAQNRGKNAPQNSIQDRSTENKKKKPEYVQQIIDCNNAPTLWPTDSSWTSTLSLLDSAAFEVPSASVSATASSFRGEVVAVVAPQELADILAVPLLVPEERRHWKWLASCENLA